MTNVAYALAALVLASGCSRSTPPPAAPSPPPPPPTEARPPAPPEPAITRLDAGGWPGSNTHRWGERFYELRTNAGQLQVRIHDAIDFQGVGMSPSDMSPTRHTCTPWEAAPAPIALPTTAPTRAGTISCGQEQALCAAILDYFKANDRTRTPGPTEVHSITYTYGRGGGAC